MFSLGTFVSSLASSERTEHARAIDHSIAITLANTVTQDGSPLVRQVSLSVRNTVIIVLYICIPPVITYQ